MPHRSPPCSFLGGCSCEGAIGFAEAAYPRKAWQALLACVAWMGALQMHLAMSV